MRGRENVAGLLVDDRCVDVAGCWRPRSPPADRTRLGRFAPSVLRAANVAFDLLTVSGSGGPTFWGSDL
jgi:hypothetical protein